MPRQFYHLFRTKIRIFFLYSYICKHKIVVTMRNRNIILTILGLLLCLPLIASEPLRSSYNINSGWRFFYSTEVDGSRADIVTLPHTWNTQCAEGGYLRTTANYTRELHIPSEWSDRRLFLRFGGVQSVADLFVNGRYVGSHEGGFTAFTMEITDYVRHGEDNFLRVVVSNVERNDILPTSSDMDLAGGIYRDVELLVTGKNIISPLNHSTDGVYVLQQSVSPELVKGVVRIYVSATTIDNTMLTLRIIRGDGDVVVTRSARASKLTTDRAIDFPFEISAPELWSPASPALYRVEVTMGSERVIEDRVSVVTGFRRITIDDGNKLCINGEPVVVRGVNLPHDRSGKGTAVLERDVARDLRIVQNMGANAIRSISGPHMDVLYTSCDREGVLVWIDMPFSRSPLSFSDICYYPTSAFRNNGFAQLEEIIAQNINHPSVVMWGLFSEVWQRGDDVVAYVRELNSRAHALDPSRLTVGCSNADGEINFITDLVVLRQNVGYMKGSVEDVAVWCRQLSTNTLWRKLRYGVCYGEEGSTSHQTERIERAHRGTYLLPERRQTYMHERYSDIIAEADIFWGVWLNSMFDYASSRRPYGLNQSGLVSYDRATAKDAYYLYRATWNSSEPTLHISDCRWTERTDTLQHVNIYSSVGQPTLVVDGDTVAVRAIARGQYRADSLTLRGRVNIVATDSTGTHHDRLELRVGSFAEY